MNMKVKELIERLNALPPDAVVCIQSDRNNLEVNATAVTELNVNGVAFVVIKQSKD